MTLSELDEEMRWQMAGIMLQALRKEAGVVLGADEAHRFQEKLMSILRIEVTTFS